MRFPLLASAPLLASVTFGAALGVAACRPAASSKPADVVEGCTRACSTRAAKHCSDHDCERGCTFVLDRLVEHEEEPVLRCVAEASGACDDAVWAGCAVRVGTHADGGPPPPPPPPED